ncbi:MAG: hypothetical protein U1F76_10115 [Candidatus Competibacteraceae bacterium]
MLDQISSVNLDNPTVTGEVHRDGTLQRRPFTEPKLQFIEPKLTKRGDLARVTAQQQEDDAIS